MSVIVGQIRIGEFPTIVCIDAFRVPLIPCIDVLVGVSGRVGIFKPRFTVKDDSVSAGVQDTEIGARFDCIDFDYFGSTVIR